MKKIAFTFILAINMVGCSTIEKYSDEDNPKIVLYSNWEKNVAPDFISGTYKNHYDALGCTAKNEQAQQERNKQLDRFILGVDSYYYRNKNLLITGKALNDTVFDIIQLGLTGAASFAGGGTPNLLAAIATAINGSKLSFDKNVFADHSTLLVASKMDQLRLSKINEITKKKTQNCMDYSLDAAMKDAIDYYYAGTVNGALLAIFSDTSNQMKDEEQKQEDIVDKDFNNLQKQKELDVKERELDLKERSTSLK